jgi:ubiquinone/menaquinone biosynthesis C-methylase UbiE
LGCEQRFPIVDGIIDMTPPQKTPAPGNYRTETLFNLIAGFYDLVLPMMSLGVWRCSPLRYIDMANQAVGRANGGVLLAAPVGTGSPLDKVLASYHDLTVIGIDQSWKMLRKAKERFDKTDHDIQLIRASFQHLPFRGGVIQSIHSLNGIHTFDKRMTTLREFARCLDENGFLGGSALVRGQEGVADTLLDRYERYGVYPLLRTAEFLTRELGEAPFCDVHFATYGAVMFFSGMKQQLGKELDTDMIESDTIEQAEPAQSLESA